MNIENLTDQVIYKIFIELTTSNMLSISLVLLYLYILTTYITWSIKMFFTLEEEKRGSWKWSQDSAVPGNQMGSESAPRARLRRTYPCSISVRVNE